MTNNIKNYSLNALMADAAYANFNVELSNADGTPRYPVDIKNDYQNSLIDRSGEVFTSFEYLSLDECEVVKF